MTDAELVDKCVAGNAIAQKLFYDKFARKMMAVSLRYAKDSDEAQDILQDAFVKVFRKLDLFKKVGSLEGWVRRIVINTALDYCRKNKLEYGNVSLDKVDFMLGTDQYIEEKMQADDLLKILQTLPTGYKVVFNLFAVEGYSHKEIAEQLGVSESTSKSQYSRAKGQLKEILEKRGIER